MDEAAELQAKIAALAGKINNQKTHRVQPYPSNHRPYAARGTDRWASRARGGRAGYHQPVQNHVWTAGGIPTPPTAELTPAPRADVPEPPTAGSNLQNGSYIPQYSVGKKELMNKETYEREQKQKQEYQQARAVEGQKQPTHAPKTPTPAKAKADRHIDIEGITFRLANQGSKLVRIPSIANALQGTPKKATVAGKDFHRTKRGNLLRAPSPTHMTRYNRPGPGAVKSAQLNPSYRSIPSKAKPQCETFTKQGSCPFGPKCRYAHDPEKVAICKGFLLNGRCPAGDYCDMSHEMSYHRVSACTHFLRGNCTNDACRYPHVNISPSASVCHAFATLGYCAKGDGCPRRHVFECPDHANNGVCTNPKCQLPHVDRASILRKAAQRQAKLGSESESDLSSNDGGSDQESEVDDVDLDERNAVMTGVDDRHEVSQQQDYISFS